MHEDFPGLPSRRLATHSGTQFPFSNVASVVCTTRPLPTCLPSLICPPCALQVWVSSRRALTAPSSLLPQPLSQPWCSSFLCLGPQPSNIPPGLSAWRTLPATLQHVPSSVRRAALSRVLLRTPQRAECQPCSTPYHPVR